MLAAVTVSTGKGVEGLGIFGSGFNAGTEEIGLGDGAEIFETFSGIERVLRPSLRVLLFRN